MIVWALLTVCLMIGALSAQELWPGNIGSVTLYKAHLLALGGWGGYWLDRALFPYDRPHTHIHCDWPELARVQDPSAYLQTTSQVFGASMLRRSIIVAACLICVGLGA